MSDEVSSSTSNVEQLLRSVNDKLDRLISLLLPDLGPIADSSPVVHSQPGNSSETAHRPLSSRSTAYLRVTQPSRVRYSHSARSRRLDGTHREQVIYPYPFSTSQYPAAWQQPVLVPSPLSPWSFMPYPGAPALYGGFQPAWVQPVMAGQADVNQSQPDVERTRGPEREPEQPPELSAQQSATSHYSTQASHVTGSSSKDNEQIRLRASDVRTLKNIADQLTKALSASTDDASLEPASNGSDVQPFQQVYAEPRTPPGPTQERDAMRVDELATPSGMAGLPANIGFTNVAVSMGRKVGFPHNSPCCEIPALDRITEVTELSDTLTGDNGVLDPF